MTTPTTAAGTDPRSYVLPAAVTSNIPATPGPEERGIFAAARGLLLEAATLLGGRPTRLHLQDNRGTYADGHVDITVYATITLPSDPHQPGRPAGAVLLTLTWGIGGSRQDRSSWTLTLDRRTGGQVEHRHLGSADTRLPAPADLALLIPDA
jgi:hypothetical protein